MRRAATTRRDVWTLVRGVASLWALVSLVSLVIGVASAGAVGSAPEAENFIPRFGEQGSGAGQLSRPAGIATDPLTGNVYVSDSENNRISEFTPWGNFIKAFGWGVADGVSEESQTCTTVCFMGIAGAGAGELANPDGLTVDSDGDVYVREPDFGSDKRVQKFSSTGQFLLMFGGEVDKTQVHKREEQEAKAEPVTVTAGDENVCTAISGDQCGAGVSGTDHGEFSEGSGIALLPDGTVVIADKERIEEFEPDGTYKGEVALPGKTVKHLAVDPNNGDFYVTFSSGEENLYKLSPTGASLGGFLLPDAGVLATDSAGNIYVSFNDNGRIVEFDPSSKKIAEFDDPANRLGAAAVQGLGTNAIGDLYISNFSTNTQPSTSFISAYGPAPVNFEPPPKVSPTIDSEYTLSTDLDSAVVQARINPHFWSDTSYYVQYGTADCAVTACAARPAAPGSKLTGSVVDGSVVSGGVLLPDLQPDTTYHYRFVSVSSGGGPVFGVDRTFTTFPKLTANFDCPNQAVRTGFSGLLADCRAYEMVSPVDKDNGDIVALLDAPSYETGHFQSSTNGNKFTYSSYRAFGGAASAPYTNQYIANRDPARGWSTESISPVQRAKPVGGLTFENQYILFSKDLSSAWLLDAGEPVLDPGAVEGVRTLYRRDDGTGGFEALSKVGLSNISPGDYEPELQGVSSNGSHAVFRANDSLTFDASSEAHIYQVYEASGGELRLVSVLPDGIASARDSSVGTVNESHPYDRFSNVSHAVSDDGSRVYWSETNSFGVLGRIYLRENADRQQSAVNGGECTETEKACTVLVSSKASEFWDASPDGSRALYTIAEGARKGELDEFDLEEASSTPIAENVTGLLGASEDLSYIYFVSTDALAPGANAGQLNLYSRHEEATSLIVTLSSADTGSGSGSTSVDTPGAVHHVARVTPDGRHIAFVSSARLAGYDNTDAVSGKPDTEVYTYDAATGQVDCVSCDRSGARPAGAEVSLDLGTSRATAASITGWMTEFYPTHVLSDDGDRLFFNSYMALVPRDTNGKEDVYEWEAAGSGDCTVQDPAFSTANGGCVSLISDGESPQDSNFVDASPNGSDVFFATSASLLPQDPGLVDVYDARVGGGFPAPAAAPASCEGEACQGSPVAPDDQTPTSTIFSGPGNLVFTPPGTVVLKGAKASRKAASEARKIALSRALRACRSRVHVKRRKSCEVTARKRYGTKTSGKAKKSTRGGK
jgi:NHL repeat